MLSTICLVPVPSSVADARKFPGRISLIFSMYLLIMVSVLGWSLLVSTTQVLNPVFSVLGLVYSIISVDSQCE